MYAPGRDDQSLTIYGAAMESYPILISIPHGGVRIPPEVRGRIALTPRETLYYSDPYTRVLYNFSDRVSRVVDTPIARAVVDLNRAPTRLPPKYPDGVIKSLTVDGKNVYRESMFPDRALIRELIRRYYFPYHFRLRAIQTIQTIDLALDCHSMLPQTPIMKNNPGKERPLFCIGNGGNEKGEPLYGKTVTCPTEWVQALAGTFRDEFGKEGPVTINTPYPGGFITVFHHRRFHTPWMQIEMNRSIYEPERQGEPDLASLERLRERLFYAIEQFWKDNDISSQDGNRGSGLPE
jgi:N-formylglutamate deformylase